MPLTDTLTSVVDGYPIPVKAKMLPGAPSSWLTLRKAVLMTLSRGIGDSGRLALATNAVPEPINSNTNTNKPSFSKKDFRIFIHS